ncbi:MAG: hypothetical protein ACYSQZ_10050 [Planctomycetota bacterium]
MKLICMLTWLFVFFSLVLSIGCEPSATAPPETAADSPKTSSSRFFTVTSIDIMPLTEFISDENTQEESQIKVYVSLLDAFGSQIKAPAVFRFELYEYLARSAEQKGRRINFWQDIDMTEPAENNKQWRDFLRAYEFTLPFEAGENQTYVLQATCICPDGRRLSAELVL